VAGVLAIVFALATVATVIWPQWIEDLTGFEPDRGSGGAEWGLVVILGVIAVAAAGLSRREYVRWRSERPGPTSG
jgi:hypothetical protein